MRFLAIACLFGLLAIASAQLLGNGLPLLKLQLPKNLQDGIQVSALKPDGVLAVEPANGGAVEPVNGVVSNINAASGGLIGNGLPLAKVQLPQNLQDGIQVSALKPDGVIAVEPANKPKSGGAPNSILGGILGLLG